VNFEINLFSLRVMHLRKKNIRIKFVKEVNFEIKLFSLRVIHLWDKSLKLHELN
jgi:hypothetical protein